MWGLGLCSVAIISLSGLFGGVFWPLINSSFYNHMMQILIGLAVGSLSATSIFQLIPEVCIRASNINVQKWNWFITEAWDGKKIWIRRRMQAIAERPETDNTWHFLFQGFEMKDDKNYLSIATFMWCSLWTLYMFEVLSKIVLHQKNVRHTNCC